MTITVVDGLEMYAVNRGFSGVECDNCGRIARPDKRLGAAEIRSWAAKKGWTNYGDKADYCKGCSDTIMQGL